MEFCLFSIFLVFHFSQMITQRALKNNISEWIFEILNNSVCKNNNLTGIIVQNFTFTSSLNTILCNFINFIVFFSLMQLFSRNSKNIEVLILPPFMIIHHLWNFHFLAQVEFTKLLGESSFPSMYGFVPNSPC